MYRISVLIGFILFHFAWSTVASDDYCAHEYFSPQCMDNEVIVMEKATYGRMELGKCLKIDPDDQSKFNPKYFGCASDVLDILDKRCSGYRTCSVHITDPELLERSTCYQGLMLYLNAKFVCQAIHIPDQSCTISISNEAIYYVIGSGTATNKKDKRISNCGSKANPILLEASFGQTITVTIIEFSEEVNNRNDSSRKLAEFCTDYRNPTRNNQHTNSGYIGSFIDTNAEMIKDKDNIIPICMTKKRQREVYASKSNKLGFHATDNLQHKAILIFKATGCYDLKPPQDAWMKRNGNEITVGCYMNRHTWKLVCNGRNWIGVIGNCTQQSQEFEKEHLLSTNNDVTKVKTESPEHVFVMVILLSLLFVTALALLCICLLCYQRIKSKNKNVFLKMPNQYNEGIMLNKDHSSNAVPQSKLPANDCMTTNSNLDPCYYVLEDGDDHKSSENIK